MKMQPHYSQSNRENVTASSGTSPLAYYSKVFPPPAPGVAPHLTVYCNLIRHQVSVVSLMKASEEVSLLPTQT